nr:hypothetical protein [uncultured Anaerotignum sp.]
MNSIKRKMKSTGGASIIIALLFFLICSAVGVSVLVAAKANASRIVSQRESERSYLAVRSAAMLMREKLEKTQENPFVECEERYDTGNLRWKQLPTENSNPSFWKEIEDALFALIQKDEDGSEERNFTIQAENVPNVTAAVTIQKKGDSYTLSGVLSCGEESDPYVQSMRLVESGEARMTLNEPITETHPNSDGTTYTETIGERRQYTAVFSEGQLGTAK